MVTCVTILEFQFQLFWGVSTTCIRACVMAINSVCAAVALVSGLADVRGERGTLVIFICNHCPYVKAVINRIIRDARDLSEHGVGTIGIMVNDTVEYPEDSFDNMKRWSDELEFPFPYVIDPTQNIGRKYEAVCTPDFFGFNSNGGLQYRGRLDDAGKDGDPATRHPELLNAMRQVAETGQGPKDQVPSMGCSIKWR